RRPIVLAQRRRGAGVAEAVAPGLPELGLMLPPSPLHQLLAEDAARPLVLTSGNLTDEPIAYEDADAFARLGPLVDAVLTHDRAIHIRCDDGVVRAGVAAGLQTVRRSRGDAPEPLPLPLPARRRVLAVGAELKNTVAVAKGTAVLVSHHIGDLEHHATYRSFLQAVDHLCHLFGVEPDVVAHDIHPEYLSTKFATELELAACPVQHHHAHVASCMVEHGRTDPVLGIAFDGLGFGTDGTLWGGEFLVADLRGFQRVGHLLPVPLPGGAAAIREPWRMAVAWLHQALGEDAVARHASVLDDRWAAMLALVRGWRGPTTSSVGRLFDAVAALLGIRSAVTYEGQAAVELEASARRVPAAEAPVYPTDVVTDGDPVVLDPSPLLAAVLAERDRGTPRETVAAGFHAGLADGVARVAIGLADRHRLDTVALSGGVFQNARLSELLSGRLAAAGLRVLTHRRIPANDGGISVGQAAIAALGATTGS
ncbi:MAG TPA: Sua5/YciO/YrdC/YwlC family protein, partial [Nitriliruptorales bacterium]|nr:Sua5/YciO/YrdC/YwlC family protein [Nitriliruptorales bacterium]